MKGQLTHKTSSLLTSREHKRLKRALAWEDRYASELIRSLVMRWTGVVEKQMPDWADK